MATLTQVVSKLSEYYGASGQDAPKATVMNLAAESAISAINEIRRYENKDDQQDVLEDKYLTRAVRIAIYLCDKEGVEGVTSFSENGLSRVYETGDIPPSLLSTVTPVCRGW